MNVLGMFARLPVAGETKTRLGKEIGFDEAASCSAAFVIDLIQRMHPIADQFVVAGTPQSAAAAAWFHSVLQGQGALQWQSQESLGGRMASWFSSQFRQGAEAAVLIGSDSPDLPQSLVQSAFEELQRSSAVLAPASDGGFVLIGLRCSADIDEIRECLKWEPLGVERTREYLP